MRRVCCRYVWAAACSCVALILAGLVLKSYHHSRFPWIVLSTYRPKLQSLAANVPAPAAIDVPAAPQCKPRRNIFFLKTHKCASSTVMNIFLRYGVTHDLYFVLPRDKKTNYVGHPRLFNRRMVLNLRPLNVTYNIFTHHSRFQKKEVAEVMPQDTVYVTIVRAPEFLFNSLYNYYNVKKYLHVELHDLLRNRTLLNKFKERRKRKGAKHGQNQIGFDMGLDVMKNQDATSIDKFIKHIQESFDLVMITERMDESLVLLKHLLCWTTEDIVAFKHNANNKASYSVDLSDDDKARLRKLNYIDVKIYQHFAKIFDQKVVEFGIVRMAREVAELQQVSDDFFDACKKLQEKRDIANVPKKKRIYLPRRFQDVGMKETCKLLTMSELQFHDFVWRKQNATLRSKMWMSAAFAPPHQKKKKKS
ncbi:galactose-3-O-sulfotransferase 4-like [Ornithodoros turicata]|uniref:galactose-3-O-sulfotransferase 4-like n=1 Tax=Ornithodoros turicata TaxID=34597 RepID=UPI00313A26A0